MNALVIVLIVVGALVVIAAAVVVSRRRRLADGVDSFRRQIDALSPEARRPVVDQVQSVIVHKDPPDDVEPGDVEEEAAGDTTDDGPPGRSEASPGDPPAGEDGERGP